MITVLYRVLYEQFLADSIASVDPYVDHVIIALQSRPWGVVSSHPDLEPYPRVSLSTARANQKVEIVHFTSVTPFNEFSRFVRDYYSAGDNPKPATLIFMEPDHVWLPEAFEDAHAEFAAVCRERPTVCVSGVTELWKGIQWRVPLRMSRKGPVWWPLTALGDIPTTGAHADPVLGGMHWLRASALDLGFCVNPAVMRVKHELACRFSAEIGDSPPNPGWYSRWLHWKPGDRNLGISLDHEDDIPEIEPYDPPWSLLRKGIF